MNFPLYDISEYSWNKYRVKEHNVLFENPYLGIIPRNKKKFTERIKNFKFVDCNGQIFKVVGYKTHPNKGLARPFSITKKIEFEFIQTNELFSLEKFKEVLIKRARETQNERLEELVKNSSSFMEIFKQFT